MRRAPLGRVRRILESGFIFLISRHPPPTSRRLRRLAARYTRRWGRSALHTVGGCSATRRGGSEAAVQTGAIPVPVATSGQQGEARRADQLPRGGREVLKGPGRASAMAKRVPDRVTTARWAQVADGIVAARRARPRQLQRLSRPGGCRSNRDQAQRCRRRVSSSPLRHPLNNTRRLLIGNGDRPPADGAAFFEHGLEVAERRAIGRILAAIE